MTDSAQDLTGPDFTTGIARAAIPDGGVLLGHAHGSAVLLSRRGHDVSAIGATCTHYGGPLVEGLVVGDTIRCPWHHACFSLRTGEALRAPALDAVSCWQVEQRGDQVYVTEPAVRHPVPAAASDEAVPNAIVIVGGGAAGNAAAAILRREGFTGRITMLSADTAVPCDRPNLSKGFLAGTAPLEYALLRTPEFYVEQRIDLLLNARVATIDTARHQVVLDDGTRHPYDALLLATGASPVPLTVPGSDLPHVHYLRTLADSQRLIAAALLARHAVVIGASFIGLEVAAALRARGVEVQVVTPDAVPMEKILGAEIGSFIRQLHEQHGVVFHTGTKASAIDAQHVTLESGATLVADLVVVGIGVRPEVALAEAAGLALDRGVVVDEYLETSQPGIFAAGDIARWPDRMSGELLRIEHWVMAERQGQTAARNMLGQRERFSAIPFFWTEQYDFMLSYVGHAAQWDNARLEGQLDAEQRDCTVTYSKAGRTLAVATVFRDLESLRAEVAFETLTAGPLG